MDREKADGVQDDARSTRPALANRPEPYRSNLRFFRLSVRSAPPGRWPRSRRPTRTTSKPPPNRLDGPLGRRPALRHRHRRLGRRPAHGPQDRPVRRPGGGRRRHQGPGAARPQDHQFRPRCPGIAGRRQAQAAGHPAALFRQVAGRGAASRRRRHLRLQAGAQRHRERRRARLQPSQHEPSAAGARRPVGRRGLGRPGQGQRQLGPGHQPRLDRRQQRHPQGAQRGAGRLRPAPRSRSGRAARSMVRRGCLPPPSAKARPSSRSGGSRRRTSRKAGSTRAAAGSAARRSPSPAAARASPRRSASAATTAARAAAASTTASISRARPACRSMRRPTA